ncbi:hypothetical protein [Immundisolibacter sp.]
MNQDQKKYLSKRIEEIGTTKKSAIKVKLDVKSYIKLLKPKPFNYKAKVSELINKLIKEERFPPHYTNFISLTESDIFENYQLVKNQYQNAFAELDKKVSSRCNQIDKYVTELKDQIMLGDAEEALKKLSEFEQMEF